MALRVRRARSGPSAALPRNAHSLDGRVHLAATTALCRTPVAPERTSGLRQPAAGQHVQMDAHEADSEAR